VLGPLGRSVASLTHGIEIAVAVAAPIAVVAIVVEVGLALIARAANPAYLLPVFAPLKAVLVLGATLLLLDRMLELLVLVAARVP
jgi:type III secretory pathway component EscT